MKLELIGMSGLALIYFLCAGLIAYLFSINEGELFALTVSGIRTYSLSLPLIGLNSIIMYYFQAQEMSGKGLIISLLSGSVFPVASLLLLIQTSGHAGIWYSFLTAQFAAFLVSSMLYLVNRMKNI